MNVTGLRYVLPMARKIWTAAEIEKLSPQEQQAIFDDAVVRDISEVPPEFLDRIRAKLAARASEADTPKSA